MALGAACEGPWAVRLGLQHGAPAHVSSGLDCTMLIKFVGGVIIL